MGLENLKQFIKNEKEKLFKAKDYIISYYQQIIFSLSNLRDNFFPYAFNQKLNWKDEIDHRNTLINLPNFKPGNLLSEPEYNSNTLLVIINNLYAIQNSYCLNPSIIEKYDISLIRKVHNFLLQFLNDLFAANIESLNRQQKELAYTLKKGIEDRLLNNITPFFDRLEMLLEDEYKINLYPHIRLLVNNFQNYKKDPNLYDGMMAQKCAELNLRNYPELNLVIIADLEKTEQAIENEIKVKYSLSEEKKTTAKSYRLKEIAARYTSQAENLQKLVLFLKEAEKALLHIPFFRRLSIFLRNLFSGRSQEIKHHTIIFSYVAPKGKIHRQQSALNEVIREVSFYYEYLSKFKEEMELTNYTKVYSLHFALEVDKFIDASSQSLNSIFEKCSGFREWLGRENNRHLLKRIPEKKQEEFNELLLHLNRTIIVNNYSLKELS